MPPKPRPARRATAPKPVPAPAALGVLPARHDLPSGGWVQLRPVSDLRAKHRDKILGAVLALAEDNAEHVFAITFTRAIATEVITAWELPYLPAAPLPADLPDVFGELTVLDENQLMALLEPYRHALDPPAPDPAQVENPDSPTGPSGGLGCA